MQEVRLQSSRTQVFFKKMFPIFVCLGKLRVECNGCHGDIFFLLLLTDGSCGTHTHSGSHLLILLILGLGWGLCPHLDWRETDFFFRV